jgi:adhesin/invasin
VGLARATLVVLPIAAAAAAVGGCGANDLTLPSEGAPARLTIASGDGQSGRVGTALADPLVAVVTDAKSRPVVGVMVAFAVRGDARGAVVAPDTAPTDSSGRASARLTLGSRVGAVGVTARVAGTTDGALDAEFGADALPASADAIAAAGGDNQSAPAGSALADPLVARVTDAFGNPVAGVTVTWTAQGGGSVDHARTTTGGDGRAQATRTLGPTAGTQSATAAAAGLAGSPVRFTHRALAGNADRLRIVSGDNQSAAPGAALAAPLVVSVTDAGDNPVGGRAVSWVVATGGGSVSAASSNTGADGRAATQWTVGATPGPNTLNAVVSGVGVATFTATATAAGSPELAVAAEPSAQAFSGQAFAAQPVIQLQTPGGASQPQAGVDVTAAIASGGGSLGGTTTRATDGAGRATFIDLQITGAAGSRALVFAADGYTSTSSRAIDVRAAGPSQANSSIAANPATITTAQTSAVTVTVQDAFGAPLAGAAVAWSSAGGSLQPPSGGTDAQGHASATFTPSTTGAAAIAAAVSAGGTTITLSTTVTTTSGGSGTLQLSFLTQPSDARADEEMEPAVVVVIQDGSGTVVTSATDMVTLTLSGGTAGARLEGGHRAAKRGVVTFEKLRVDRPGTGYRLVAAVAGAPPVTSNPFDVTP